VGNSVILESEIVRNGNEEEFVTTCATVKGTHKGCGKHKKSKKKSIQLAYLSCMLDMKLISKEEHLEQLSQASMKDKVAAKSRGSSKKDGEQAHSTSEAKEEKVMNEKQTEIGASKMEEETKNPT